MQVIKKTLCFLLVWTQISQAAVFSNYLADFYNRYRSQSNIVQLILPTALFSTVGIALYYKYIYAPYIAEQAAKREKEAKDHQIWLKQIREQTEETIRTIEAEQAAKALNDKRVAEERVLIQQKKLAQEQKQKQERQAFFAPLKEYQARQLTAALSTVSNGSITTLYQNSGRSGALIIPQEIIKKHQNNLPEVLSQYNLTLSGWTKSQWNEALEELNNQHAFSKKLFRPIHLEQVRQLIDDAKTISKAFLPPHEIKSTDQEQHFFTKKHSSARRIFTYIKLKKVIEDKKLANVHLPLKFLVIRNTQTNQYITDKESIASLIDKNMTIEIDYAAPGYGSLICVGPLFLDQNDTYDTAILAEKITDSATPLNDKARNQLQQLVQDAPFDIGFGNIFTDDNGDAIIIDTEFKGEPASSCITKLNRYR